MAVAVCVEVGATGEDVWVAVGEAVRVAVGVTMVVPVGNIDVEVAVTVDVDVAVEVFVEVAVNVDAGEVGTEPSVIVPCRVPKSTVTTPFWKVRVQIFPVQERGAVGSPRL